MINLETIVPFVVVGGPCVTVLWRIGSAVRGVLTRMDGLTMAVSRLSMEVADVKRALERAAHVREEDEARFLAVEHRVATLELPRTPERRHRS